MRDDGGDGGGGDSVRSDRGRIMRTRVVHVADKVPGAVYIGRAMPRQRLAESPFANPFRIGPDGQRRHVIAKYRNWLDAALLSHNRRQFAEQLIALRGKPLACWCRHDGDDRDPGNACHGDVLVAFLDEHTDDELREVVA